MKWILRLLAFVALLAAAVYATGLALPARTTHTRTITLQQPPEKVFDALADVQGMAKWNRNTEKVEMLPPVDGKETTRQTFKGGMVMTITTTESSTPTHLVRAIGDPHATFSGLWSYQISANNGGSSVALTEESEIRNPLFRIMVRIFGPTKYIDEHLEDLAKHFDETAIIR